MKNLRNSDWRWLILRMLVLSKNWLWVHCVLFGYPMLNSVLDEGCCWSSSPYSRGRRDHVKEREMDSARLVLNSYSIRILFWLYLIKVTRRSLATSMSYNPVEIPSVELWIAHNHLFSYHLSFHFSPFLLQVKLEQTQKGKEEMIDYPKDQNWSLPWISGWPVRLHHAI